MSVIFHKFDNGKAAFIGDHPADACQPGVTAWMLYPTLASQDHPGNGVARLSLSPLELSDMTIHAEGAAFSSFSFSAYTDVPGSFIRVKWQGGQFECSPTVGAWETYSFPLNGHADVTAVMTGVSDHTFGVALIDDITLRLVPEPSILLWAVPIAVLALFFRHRKPPLKE